MRRFLGCDLGTAAFGQSLLDELRTGADSPAGPAADIEQPIALLEAASLRCVASAVEGDPLSAAAVARLQSIEGMAHLELVIFGLLVAVAGFAVLARVLDVPYPILLVVGGSRSATSRESRRSRSRWTWCC